jgi:hypothetical protein
MKKNKILALECLWEEAKLYSILYHQTTNEYKKQKYVSHFRSPIFDETNNKIFKKDFISLSAFNNEGKITDEHCNGRTNCSKHLLEKIHKKEITNFNEFLEFLINYCYTIKILSKENILVAAYLKKNKSKNFIDAYKDLGIIICDNNGNKLEKLDLLVI